MFESSQFWPQLSLLLEKEEFYSFEDGCGPAYVCVLWNEETMK